MTTPLIEYGRTGRPLPFPVYDVHAHINDFSTITTPGNEALIREMDRIGVRASIISSVDAIYGDVRRGNDDVAEAVQKYPGRFFGYCHVSAQYPNLIIPEVERCFATPWFKGIKVYQVGTNYDDPLFDPLWRFAENRQIPVLAHTWGTSLTGYDNVAPRFPGVPFLMGHSGSGFAYDCYIKAAGKSPNLYLDLTYSREHTNMIEHMVGAVGAERVVWGSDSPTFSMGQQIGKVLFARISDADKKTILLDNAARLFNVPAT